MKKCPFCAEEIQDGAIYCRWCKHDLNKENILSHQEKKRTDEQKKGLNGLFWLVLIAGVIVGYILLSGKLPLQFQYKSSPTKTSTPNVSLEYASTCMIKQQNVVSSQKKGVELR